MTSSPKKNGNHFGFSLIETAVGVALIALAGTFLIRVSVLQISGQSHLEIKGNVEDVRRFVSGAMDCGLSFADQAERCEENDYVILRKSDNSILTRQFPEVTVAGKGVGIRARCENLGGFYGVHLEYSRMMADGTVLNDPLTRRPYEWKSLTNEIPLVCPIPGPPQCNLTFSPVNPRAGQMVTFQMTTSGNVATAVLDGTPVSNTGGTKMKTFSAEGSYTVVGSVTGPTGSTTCEADIEVAPPAAPTCTLTASRSTIVEDQSITFTLATSGTVTSAVLDGTAVAATGGRKTKVFPTQGTYTISGRVIGPGGSRNCSTRITVRELLVSRNVVFTRLSDSACWKNCLYLSFNNGPYQLTGCNKNVPGCGVQNSPPISKSFSVKPASKGCNSVRMRMTSQSVEGGSRTRITFDSERSGMSNGPAGNYWVTQTSRGRLQMYINDSYPSDGRVTDFQFRLTWPSDVLISFKNIVNACK